MELANILLILVLIILVFVVFAFIKVILGKNKNKDNLSHEVNLGDSLSNIELTIQNRLNNIKGELKVDLIKEISEGQNKINESLLNGLLKNSNDLNKKIDDSISVTQKTLREELEEIRNITDKKLNEINGNVSKKLDDSLNKRLDESFSKVGERLESLYKSLGELQKLEGGVDNLNRTLSNIKTRGIFGEIQLENILKEILTPSQYDKNVEIKKSSGERVEFAVKIPSKQDSSTSIYLPIDAKFPAEIYNKLVEASKLNDIDTIKSATKELEQRVKKDAKDIYEKYVCPPLTTDFAIMFVPTESIYAEILRLDNLSFECQSKYKVVICGPQNITALLNSLSIGFRYLTVNKNAADVLKILEDFRTQYKKFAENIDKIENQLNTALKTADSLKNRNKIVGQRLDKLDKISINTNQDNLFIDDVV